MTPMQELIKEIDDAKKTVSSLSELKGINKVLFLAEHKLEKEKELITDSYVIGYGDAVREHVNGLDGIYQHSEDYYNSLTL